MRHVDDLERWPWPWQPHWRHQPGPSGLPFMRPHPWRVVGHQWWRERLEGHHVAWWRLGTKEAAHAGEV